MESITRFITQKLKLKVNEAKSAVARPQERKFLGFSFTAGPDTKRTIAPKSLERFKQRIREITRRAKGVSIATTMEELAPYMRGWRGYFGFCETPEVLIALTRWVRLRLRAALWRQWKTPRRRRAALIALPSLRGAAQYGNQRPWPLAHRPEQSYLNGSLQCPLQIARSPLLDRGALAQLLEPPYTDPYVVVWEGRGQEAPPYPDHWPIASFRAMKQFGRCQRHNGHYWTSRPLCSVAPDLQRHFATITCRSAELVAVGVDARETDGGPRQMSEPVGGRRTSVVY